MTEFLLEVYLPATDSDALDGVSAFARAGAEHLAAEGCRIAFLHVIYVPEDQTCFYLYEADSADEVREAAHRAQIWNRPGRGRNHTSATEVTRDRSVLAVDSTS